VDAIDLVLDDQVDLTGAIRKAQKFSGEIAPYPIGNP